ncbi:V-type ATP synthase subunit E family protein [Eubacteriaceae bacterium ES3]|nr:V-type ATP synthase subunit E family protein [Eubacteriaceae bacterium ES3]
MISVEEKLRVFTQYLIKKERTWGKDIIQEARNKQKELLEQSEAFLKKEKHAIEERSYRVIYRDKNKIIAQGKNKAKNLELAEKNIILKDFNELILKKANQLIKGDAYKQYLESCLKEVPEVFKNTDKLRISCNQKDHELIKEIAQDKLPAYEIEYQMEDHECCIGGLMVEDGEGRIQINFSIENLIQGNYKTIGMTLNGFMKKVN